MQPLYPELDKVSAVRNQKEFPLIVRYFYTGEPINPFRCECCVTKKQRARACALASQRPDGVRGECCRKCGIRF